MFRTITILALFASITAPAMADLAPPPPDKGFKRVPFENVLRLQTEIPDYRFYTFERLGVGSDYDIGKELKLETKTGIPVPSSSSPSVRTGIIAVPQKMMDELKTKDELSKFVSDDPKVKPPSGVVVFWTRGTIRDVKVSDSRTKVENIITVSPDQKAGVKFSAKETEPKPSSGSPFAIPIAIAALLLSIAFVAFLLVRGKLKSSRRPYLPTLAAR